MPEIRARRFLPFVICASALFAGPACAVNPVIPIPSGWRPCEYVFAAASGTVGFVLYPSTGDPFASTSRILMSRAGVSKSVDLRGKVFALSLSSNGLLALAQHENANGPSVSLVDATGAVVWSKLDTRRFEFTLDGKHVVAWQPRSESARPNGKVEVLGTDGTTVRTFDFDHPVGSPVVSDSLSEITILKDGTLSRFGADPSMHLICSMELPSAEAPKDIRPVGSDRLLLTSISGRFRIVNASDCASLYKYDPQALHDADPDRSVSEFASYQPYVTPPRNTVLLFRNSSDALVLNPSNGTITGTTLDVAAPSGYTPLPWVRDGKLAFVSPTGFLVRAIALPR